MDNTEFNQIKELMTHMAESGVTEISIKSGGDTEIAMSRLPDGLKRRPAAPVHEAARPAPAGMAAEPAPEHDEAKDKPVTVLPEQKAEVMHGRPVKSPIVGTFYASSSPASPPLVSVGSVVKKGDPLCIIEAMKVMNEITSDFGGTVTEIRVQNEQMVEYGQILFVIA